MLDVMLLTAGKMLMFVYVLASIVKIGAICNLKGKALGQCLIFHW